MKFAINAIPALLLSNAAWAHDGHGMAGTHWHATDAWGFALAGVLIALAIWLSRGGK
ncbi:MAG TPA: hypothetical protein VLJ57_23500 [Burkholderiaceae bacterium]|nr:hypothetical protein [Burkholderiaceae bacterium]